MDGVGYHIQSSRAAASHGSDESVQHAACALCIIAQGVKLKFVTQVAPKDELIAQFLPTPPPTTYHIPPTYGTATRASFVNE
jgi:hypothetical protein